MKHIRRENGTLTKQMDHQVSESPSYQYGDYFIQPYGLRTNDNEQIFVHRVVENTSQQNNSASREPVLMLHGSYSNRHFWISPKGLGLAPYLFDQGFDVWVIEFRGHGASPKSAQFKHYLAEQWGQSDLPAAINFIYEQTQQAVNLTAHSAGGVNLLAALSKQKIDESKLMRAVLLGVQTTYGQDYLKNSLLFMFIKFAMKVYGRFPAKKLKFGPEDESNSVMLQMMNWRRTGKWLDSQGNDFWQGIPNIKLPIMMITSDGDAQDPKKGVELLFERFTCEKDYICLGKALGYKKDYSHPGMVVDKDAKLEVYPLVLDWLKK